MEVDVRRGGAVWGGEMARCACLPAHCHGEFTGSVKPGGEHTQAREVFGNRSGREIRGVEADRTLFLTLRFAILPFKERFQGAIERSYQALLNALCTAISPGAFTLPKGHMYILTGAEFHAESVESIISRHAASHARLFWL